MFSYVFYCSLYYIYIYIWFCSFFSLLSSVLTPQDDQVTSECHYTILYPMPGHRPLWVGCCFVFGSRSSSLWNLLNYMFLITVSKQVCAIMCQYHFSDILKERFDKVGSLHITTWYYIAIWMARVCKSWQSSLQTQLCQLMDFAAESQAPGAPWLVDFGLGRAYVVFF